MSFKIDGTDIVISGFDKGIADSPYEGINDIRGMNIISIPGEAMISFDQRVQSLSNFVGTIASFSGSIITPTVTSGSLSVATTYTAIQFTTTGTLPTGLSLNTTYYVLYDSGTTFKVYSDCYLNTQVIFTNATGSGVHTFTSINIGQVRYFERIFGYAIDTNGRVWTPVINSLSGSSVIYYAFMNNYSSTSKDSNSNGNGICVYKGSNSNKYLFIFRNGQIDYTLCADVLGVFNSTGSTESGITPNWACGGDMTKSWNPNTGTVGVTSVLNTPAITNNPHEAMVDINNVMFFTDASFVASLRELPGSSFDPTNASTYEWNVTALALPKNDIAQCLDQLGDRLLIGGLYNFIYSWNKFSTGFDTLQITEKGITRLITISTNTFIFAGKRGRIFYTNGSQANLFKKVPDFILGPDPAFTFYGVGYNKNQLYFGLSATKNDGTASTAYSGLWAIDIDSKALRVPTILSTSTAYVSAIFTLPTASSGFSLFTAWTDTAGPTYGIDASLPTPYTSYNSYIDTDIINIGQFLKKSTFNNVEFKLAAPLVSGEGVKIWYRTSLTDTYQVLGETTTAGFLSDVYTPNFEGVEWIQFRVQTKSTSSSPSYVRLIELRLRRDPNM